MVDLVNLIRNLKLYSAILSFMVLLSSCIIAKDADFMGDLYTPSIMEKFSGVCSGGANVNAANYKGHDKIHPIVLLNTFGDLHEWSDDLPDDWWANSENEIELVACLSAQTLVRVETCTYILTSFTTINRNVWQVSAKLSEARTGKILASKTFQGSSPRPCGKEERTSTMEINGEYVPFGDVINWLEDFVEH